MLCKCYWIVLYIVHFTAFCLGGPFFPVTVYSVRMQISTNAPRSTADVMRTQLVSTQSVATSATVNPAIKATEHTVQVRDKIQSCWNS